MNNKEFFNILIGKPPLEVELEIEMKCREVDQLPESYLKAYSFALIKENRLQDLLIIAAMQRIQDTEIKLMRYEMAEHHRTKNLALQKKKRVKKKTIIQKLKAMIGIIS
jgi:hypothetical protein|tara:strand:- start:205 stop:531 length:327 start_codon:yes stop_codon:yes gene_type:complete